MSKNERSERNDKTEGAPEKKSQVVFKSSIGKTFCDYKNAEDLKRLLTPNGRIQGRKRTGLSAREQRLATQSIKRARFMALLPYTSATI